MEAQLEVRAGSRVAGGTVLHMDKLPVLLCGDEITPRVTPLEEHHTPLLL